MVAPSRSPPQGERQVAPEYIKVASLKIKALRAKII